MSGLTLSALLALASVCAPHVAPGTMLSLVMAESGGRVDAVNVNRNYTVDYGLAQVNTVNLGRLGLTPQTAMDPCRSLGAAERILLEGYNPVNDTLIEQQRALRSALAAYNVGERGNPKLGDAYVRRIQAVASRVIPEIRLQGVPSAPPQARGDGPNRAAQEATSPRVPMPPAPVFIGPSRSSGRELVYAPSTR